MRLKQSALLVATLGKPGGFAKLAEADDDDDTDERTTRAVSRQPRPVLEGIHVVELDSPRQLPVDALGYDTLDILVISGKYDLDRRRSIALRRWIRNGGHLIFCRGSELDTFIQVAEGNVENVDPEHISRWLPIKIVDQSLLRDLGGIETYAARKTAIIFSGRARAARIEDLSKRPYGGVTVLATGIDGPLFVRAAYGFGKITFCGLDFHRPPLLNWREVGSIARRIVNDAHPKLASSGRVSTSRRLARSGVTDLGTQLNAIQQDFPEVQRASTIWTMLWLVLFIICIGPVDYFLVHRILKRPRLTWLTFPLMVVAVSFLAFRNSEPVGEKQLLMNQLEIVDVDATAPQELVRVNAWMTVFSPETRRYRFSLEPGELVQDVGSRNDRSNVAGRSVSSLLAWDGVPESTYGGMYRTSGVSFDGLGYDITPQTASLGDLPVKVRSTASLKATSYYQGAQIIDANLSANTVGDLSGTLQHQLGATLEDWILVYGTRIYFPSTDATRQVAPGEKWSPIDQGVRTADLRSTLTGVRLTKEQKTESKGTREISEQAEYDPHSRDAEYLLRILTFHNAAGGYEYTGLNHHALGGLELSGLLHLQRAILIGRVKLPASRLLRHGEDSEQGTAVTAQRPTPVDRHDNIQPSGVPERRRARASRKMPRAEESRNNVIETKKLTKRYGDLIAANEIDLKLEQGDVFGFIGPNGSGKTTTMRMIATLLNPDYGEAYVCGQSIYTNPEEIRRMVGYMPDFFGVYDDMTVLEYLEFFAAAYRIDGPARRKVAEEKLELVDMSFKRDAMVNQLSRGQTQRIGLARVMLHDPQVLLLDEPASGLDPRARIEIRNLLKRLGDMNKTVIVSSHILPELADVCTRVGMIEKGNMIVDGYVDEVMSKAREAQLIFLRVADGVEKAAALVEQHESIERVTMERDTIVATMKKHVTDYSFLPAMLIEAGFALTMFREEEINLETAFLELTKGKQQ
eukprot:g8378.t1